MRSGLTSSWASHVLFFLVFTGLAAASSSDPVDNFCRRYGHQTAVVDGKLFIDGGIINYSPLGSDPTNYTNTWLAYQDLDTVADSGMPQLHANLTKNASIPNVHGGTLWADDVNKRFYLFGGEYLEDTPTRMDLYSYDVINNYWDVSSPRGDSSIQRTSYGAGVSISERGEGYYYGGWLSNKSVSDWGDQPAMATTGLVKYTMDKDEWTNSTGPDEVRRAEGQLLFIPAGDAGLLVYLGGVQDNDGTITGQSMEEIFIYDVLSKRWYTQQTTGDAPADRRRFCAGVTWPEDQSSYNIYLYGGAHPPDVEGPGFDDLYVLTMPYFEWIKVFPEGDGVGDYPHHSLSCDISPGQAQMLIIGGHFPTTSNCDVPDQWGTHNADLGRQNKDNSPWALFEPDKVEYVVPSDVVAVVGGDGSGGASKTAPASGYDYNDLRVLMTRKAEIPERSPSREIVEEEDEEGDDELLLPTGAIIGIAVGGFVLVAGIALGIFFCCRHKRKQRRLALLQLQAEHDQQQQQQQQQQHTIIYPDSPPQPDSRSAMTGWSKSPPSAAATSPTAYYSSPKFERPETMKNSFRNTPVELPSDEVLEQIRRSRFGSKHEPYQQAKYMGRSHSHTASSVYDRRDSRRQTQASNESFTLQSIMSSVQRSNSEHSNLRRGQNWNSHWGSPEGHSPMDPLNEDQIATFRELQRQQSQHSAAPQYSQYPPPQHSQLSPPPRPPPPAQPPYSPPHEDGPWNRF